MIDWDGVQKRIFEISKSLALTDHEKTIIDKLERTLFKQFLKKKDAEILKNLETDGRIFITNISCSNFSENEELKEVSELVENKKQLVETTINKRLKTLKIKIKNTTNIDVSEYRVVRTRVSNFYLSFV